MIVKVRGLEKSYGKLKVLNGINLEVPKGAVISIVGASGAGKSTLLHILGTLDYPEKGSVEISGHAVQQLRGKQLAQFRNRHIGFIFQFHQLLPEFTAIENVCMPAYIAGCREEEAKAKAGELLSLLKLSDRASHKPSQLSGGEQQRVAIARALINNPELILADEPSGNLDSVNAKALHKLFFEIREKLGKTIIIVTHNEELAEMADRRLVMSDGKILD